MANKGGAYIAWIAGIVLGIYLLNQAGILNLGATTAQPLAPSKPGVTPGELPCPYAPTIALGANDKYTTGQINWGNWKYKLNGGTTTTDADGSFEVAKGSDLEVLVADGNSSTFYRAIWKPSIDVCGLNSKSYDEVIKFTNYEVTCYNENGDAMNGTGANNLSIGTGGSRNVKCELTGVSKKGMPYGGVMVLELNKTTYDEEETVVSWEGAELASVGTPGAYTIGATSATTKSFSVPAFEGAVTRTFYINLKADDSYNPTVTAGITTTAYGNGIVGHIFPINCFEEEDVIGKPSEFKCAVEDKDQTFTSPGGTTKAAGQATTFIIPVS